MRVRLHAPAICAIGKLLSRRIADALCITSFSNISSDSRACGASGCAASRGAGTSRPPGWLAHGGMAPRALARSCASDGCDASDGAGCSVAVEARRVAVSECLVGRSLGWVSASLLPLSALDRLLSVPQ